MKKYIASISGGKDSTAMILKILEKNMPLDECIFFDTGWEYQAIYKNIKKIEKILNKKNIKLVILKSVYSFDFLFSEKTVKKRNGKMQNGYLWCGGRCRWGTKEKTRTCNKYLREQGECIQYIGIAADEKKRIKKNENIIYPLVNESMTEKDCLEYCKKNGFDWKEKDIELYDILDRVSCFCCRNKNMKELNNMRIYLPEYWEKLKEMQKKVDMPFRKDGKTISELELYFTEKEKKGGK